MNRHVSSRLEMGARALEFSRAHPLDSPGYATTLKQLEEQLVRSDRLAKEQERGTTEVTSSAHRTPRRCRLPPAIRSSRRHDDGNTRCPVRKPEPPPSIRWRFSYGGQRTAPGGPGADV